MIVFVDHLYLYYIDYFIQSPPHGMASILLTLASTEMYWPMLALNSWFFFFCQSNTFMPLYCPLLTKNHHWTGIALPISGIELTIQFLFFNPLFSCTVPSLCSLYITKPWDWTHNTFFFCFFISFGHRPLFMVLHPLPLWYNYDCLKGLRQI